MHSISFESFDTGAIDFCLVRSTAELLRYIMLGQSFLVRDLNRTALHIRLRNVYPNISSAVTASLQLVVESNRVSETINIKKDRKVISFCEVFSWHHL